MDGAWHYNDNLLSNMSAQKIFENDDFKKRVAEKNGYKVIRIDCNYSWNQRFEYIKFNVLTSDVSLVLDLSLVDFEKCDVKANTSDFLDVCYMYDNVTHDIDKISKEIGLSRGIIIQHLKNSERIGCSTYNHKQALLERNNFRKQKVAKTNGRMILCESTMQVFYSIACAQRYYGGRISDCLNGSQEYTISVIDGTKLYWRYISEHESNQLVDDGVAVFINVNFQRDMCEQEVRKYKYVVKCVQTGEYFINGAVADKKYKSHVAGYFCHNRKYSGIHNGAKLTWERVSVSATLKYIQNGGIIIS
jgi:hypothetical protein